VLTELYCSAVFEDGGLTYTDTWKLEPDRAFLLLCCHRGLHYSRGNHPFALRAGMGSPCSVSLRVTVASKCGAQPSQFPA
jgi:hypothetical protein